MKFIKSDDLNSFPIPPTWQNSKINQSGVDTDIALTNCLISCKIVGILFFKIDYQCTKRSNIKHEFLDPIIIINIYNLKTLKLILHIKN